MCRERTQPSQRRLCFVSGKEEGCTPVLLIPQRVILFLLLPFHFSAEQRDVYDTKGYEFIRNTYCVHEQILGIKPGTRAV